MKVKYKKAPGQRMIKRLSLKHKSWLNGFGGALLFSIGQSISVSSWIKLYQGLHKPTYIFLIVLGLVVTLAGFLVMGKALIFSAQIKTRKYFKKRQNVLLKKKGELLANETLKIERKKP